LIAGSAPRFNRRERTSLPAVRYLGRVIFPPPLRPGDRIAVVAPSGPFDRAAALRGIAWLEKRYRVSYRPSLFSREGYLAGSDKRRIDELQRALDSDVRAVVAARGGYGLSRIAGAVDWKRAMARPRWIVGFSDITVLHVEAWRRRLASAHGAMVCSLGLAGEVARRRWVAMLERPLERREWPGLVAWRRGRAAGTLVGGNLAILHACAAASRLRIPKGAVVFLEDIGERPYRVDRMLTNLVAGGHFASASAFVVGGFTDCKPGPDRTTVEEVLCERLGTLGVPVVAALPAGHGPRNDPLILGRRAEVDADHRAFRLL
jgi:muramoyltetrapeptide carboxypeptidase